jgi:type IV secretion system protein VirB2
MNSLAPRAAGKLACHRARVSRGKCGTRPLRTSQRAAAAAALQVVPMLAVAQSSPFMTGASALQTNILAWLTPIAVILIMVLGAMAMANRMSWGWCIGAILGIAIAFGAPQIVTWVRGMFGV